MSKLCGDVSCVGKLCGDGGRPAEGGGGSAQPKTRNPHKDVGKNAGWAPNLGKHIFNIAAAQCEIHGTEF